MHSQDRIKQAMASWEEAHNALIDHFEQIDQLKKQLRGIESYLLTHQICRYNGQWEKDNRPLPKAEPVSPSTL